MVSHRLETVLVSNVSYRDDLAIWGGVRVRSTDRRNLVVCSLVLHFPAFLRLYSVFRFVTKVISAIAIVHVLIRNNSNWRRLWGTGLLRSTWCRG